VTYLSASSWENGVCFEDGLDKLASVSVAVFVGAHCPVNKEIFDIPLDRAEHVCVFGEELDCIVCPGSSLPAYRATVNASIAKFRFGKEK
jgi:hypothetical protein